MISSPGDQSRLLVIMIIDYQLVVSTMRGSERPTILVSFNRPMIGLTKAVSNYNDSPIPTPTPLVNEIAVVVSESVFH